MTSFFTSRLFVIVFEDCLTEVHDSTAGLEGDGDFMVFNSNQKAEEMRERLLLDVPGRKCKVISLLEYLKEVEEEAYLVGFEVGYG